MDYRHEAKRHLQKAETELNSDDDQRIKYAALELRMAMEALTYDRAAAYKNEFPPSEYETWQPKKVMAVLLEFDPTADKDSHLSFGREDALGNPPKKLKSVGTEKVLNMATIKEHYNAIGNLLHMPNLKQSLAGGTHNYKKMRKRCEAIASYISGVLASPIYNITLGNFSTLQCSECGGPIRKRIPHDCDELEAVCFECVASYSLKVEDNGKVTWTPQQENVLCANQDCDQEIVVWRKEIEIGRYWTCKKCGGRNVFGVSLFHNPKVSSD